MLELSRIRRLAGLLKEAEPYIMSPDENDDMDNQADTERQARETRVKALVAHAFKRLRIDLADTDFGPSIYYDEGDGEVTVTLDDSEIDIDRLIALKKSGLSDRYLVQVGNHALDIVFVISPNLTAKPSST